ncbi:MAG: DUF1127 domain-containing protein [Acetobacteraceae bacterium]|nr:DUF1127 domain-containing protein [Acetobacteraceae bacterium]
MSAHTNPNPVVYMPTTLAYSNVTKDRAVGTTRPSGLGAAFANAIRYLASIPARRAVMGELARLSDRELADIGLSRSEIATVFSRRR